MFLCCFNSNFYTAVGDRDTVGAIVTNLDNIQILFRYFANKTPDLLECGLDLRFSSCVLGMSLLVLNSDPAPE